LIQVKKGKNENLGKQETLPTGEQENVNIPIDLPSLDFSTPFAYYPAS